MRQQQRMEIAILGTRVNAEGIAGIIGAILMIFLLLHAF